MAIIDELEGRARGIYSGSLGFLSFNDTFDLNIVIRTAVISPARQQQVLDTAACSSGVASNGNGCTATQSQPAGVASTCGQSARAGGRTDDRWQDGWVSIGAGGAVVVQSDPEAEYEEMRLKARALLAAIGKCDGTGGPAQVQDMQSRQG
jgi:para-aminobenzoate synthetase